MPSIIIALSSLFISFNHRKSSITVPIDTIVSLEKRSTGEFRFVSSPFLVLLLFGSFRLYIHIYIYIPRLQSYSRKMNVSCWLFASFLFFVPSMEGKLIPRLWLLRWLNRKRQLVRFQSFAWMKAKRFANVRNPPDPILSYSYFTYIYI